LADLPLGMTAHIVYEAMEDDCPPRFRPNMIRMIRDEIGFDGA
jgi:beta-N-acetylhexosaminidase